MLGGKRLWERSGPESGEATILCQWHWLPFNEMQIQTVVKLRPHGDLIYKSRVVCRCGLLTHNIAVRVIKTAYFPTDRGARFLTVPSSHRMTANLATVPVGPRFWTQLVGSHKSVDAVILCDGITSQASHWIWMRMSQQFSSNDPTNLGLPKNTPKKSDPSLIKKKQLVQL